MKCLGFAMRNISDADVIAYAQRAGPDGNDQLCSVQASMLTGRFYYYKNTPGDCPNATRISLGPSAGITKGLSVAGTGIAAASSISLFATGGAGIGASAGGSGVALGGLPAAFGAATAIGAVVAIPLIVWSVISKHHKIAVAKEQATLCDVSQAYNQWADTVEFGISSGQVTVADAKNAVPVMEVQLMQALQAIVKGGCNAACYFQKGLKAMDLYSVEKLFDSLNPRGSGNPVNIAQPNTVQKSNLGTYGIAGAGALAAYKLAGVLV